MVIINLDLLNNLINHLEDYSNKLLNEAKIEEYTGVRMDISILNSAKTELEHCGFLTSSGEIQNIRNKYFFLGVCDEDK